jgi:hypothetical protein
MRPNSFASCEGPPPTPEPCRRSDGRRPPCIAARVEGAPTRQGVALASQRSLCLLRWAADPDRSRGPPGLPGRPPARPSSCAPVGRPVVVAPLAARGGHSWRVRPLSRFDGAGPPGTPPASTSPSVISSRGPGGPRSLKSRRRRAPAGGPRGDARPSQGLGGPGGLFGSASRLYSGRRPRGFCVCPSGGGSAGGRHRPRARGRPGR